MSERKYALVKVGAGDYILPSDDAATLWRIRIYEDGPSHGLDWPRDRDLWGIWRWTGLIGPTAYVDIDDWGHWEMVGGGYDRRREAIEAALRIVR
jgi:hypothetical protein